MPTYRAKLYRGKFYAVWTAGDGSTKRQALRTTDREEAERRLIDFRRDMAAECLAECLASIRTYDAPSR